MMYEWWMDKDLMFGIFVNILFFGAIGVVLIEKSYYCLKHKLQTSPTLEDKE